MNDNDSSSAAQGWLEKVEEAMAKATAAATEAWNATEDVREQAWETAKRAAGQATEAMNSGLEAAKAAWEQASGSDVADAPDAPDSDVVPPVDEGGATG